MNSKENIKKDDLNNNNLDEIKFEEIEPHSNSNTNHVVVTKHKNNSCIGLEIKMSEITDNNSLPV